VKKEKTRIVVSNVWKDNSSQGNCSVCNTPINADWGDYIFKIYKGRDKKNAAPLCKVCAVKLEKEKNVKLVPESYFQNQIQLKNSFWRKSAPEKD
jgi:hypothetical protein